jgi:hypothetical protein
VTLTLTDFGSATGSMTMRTRDLRGALSSIAEKKSYHRDTEAQRAG